MTDAPTLVLASASPARLATLRAAGFDPEVIVSQVNEDEVLENARAQNPTLSHDDAVLLLARAKAENVADSAAAPTAALVLGCDSMLEIDGTIVGKPFNADVAAERWRSMRGRSGILHSGHWLIDLREGSHGVGETSSTIVHFADVSDSEVEAYVATGEPLSVAGAFTVDGRGGPFVERIEGDHHGVVGVSLPLMRHLLERVGVSVTDLWA